MVPGRIRFVRPPTGHGRDHQGRDDQTPAARDTNTAQLPAASSQMRPFEDT
jgi:hypothetical protein